VGIQNRCALGRPSGLRGSHFLSSRKASPKSELFVALSRDLSGNMWLGGKFIPPRYRRQPQCDRSGVEPNACAEAERRHPDSFHVLERSRGTRRRARRIALSQAGFNGSSFRCCSSCRTEHPRKLANALAQGFERCVDSCLSLSDVREVWSLHLFHSRFEAFAAYRIHRQEGECLRQGTPSAPVCRNSMCAFTFPNNCTQIHFAKRTFRNRPLVFDVSPLARTGM